VQHEAVASSRAIGLALAVPLALYSLTLSALHAAADRNLSTLVPAVAVAVATLLIAALGLAMPVAVLLIGVAMAAAVAQHVVSAQRQLAAAPQDGR
jgi:hypothetical protein